MNIYILFKMLKRSLLIYITLVSLMILGIFIAEVSGGAFYDETRGEPIRRGFKSYSLILISNPEWLIPENKVELEDLYRRFKAFGRAIGPDHLAVWFWKQAGSIGDIQEFVDVERMSFYCYRLGLPPSGSPYIVVTSNYPGEGLLSDRATFNNLKNYSVISLNGASASEINEALIKIADKLVVEGIYKADPNTELFWRKWQKVFEGIRAGLLGLSERIGVSIDTSFFSIQLKSDSDSD